MQLKYTLAALAVTTMAANAGVIATTGFESAEGFANNVNSNFNITTGGATWTTGGTGNYAGAWATAGVPEGTQAAVFGNVNTAGHFLTVDPTLDTGIGSIEFSWERFTTTTAPLTVQWSDNDGASWNFAETIDITGSAGGGWTTTSVAINQPGDVSVRLILETGTGGASFDAVTITSIPEPSSAALLGLGGIALILHRRK